MCNNNMLSLNRLANLIDLTQNNNIEKIIIKHQETTLVINKRKHAINLPNQNIVKKKKIKVTHGKEQIAKNIPNTVHTEVDSINDVQEKAPDQSVKYSTIISPMVGTFYRSPAPNEPPFAEVNNTVRPKQTVCIIEAMKLMNEIEAEVQGEIVEILVQDGEIVDCGQALIKVKLM